MPQQVKKSLVLSIYFALAVSALLVFWQVRNFDFVSYDDDLYVYENPHVISGLTFDNIKWAFTTGQAANWHPVTWLSLMLDCQLFGAGAGRIHLVNLVLHIANTLLLFTVLRKMTGALWQSAFVAAAFALHPLHVESVAWVSERKDVLSAFFWILTIAAYYRYIKRPDIAGYLLTILVFALGLMAKPMVVTLPFVLLLLDYWPLERIKHFDRQVIYRLVLEKIPFIVLSIASSVVTFLAQQSSRVVISFDRFPLKFRIGNALVSYIKYIEKMIWPDGLAVFYPHPYGNVSVLYAAISAILLLAVTILVLRLAKNHRYFVTGWFWYLGTLIPVIGIVQAGLQARADRYTYIPYVGLFIMLAWGLPELLKKIPQRKIVLGVSMVIVLTALGICAHRQSGYWKNGITLFSHTIEAVPQNNWLAFNNLGLACSRHGRYNEAIEAYKQAIKIKPNLAESYTNLGAAYANLGHLSEAIDAFKMAAQIDPDLAEAHYNLGYAYAKLGRYTEAIDIYKQAIGIKPDYALAHYNLGVAYLAIDDKDSAMAEYNILKSLNPEMAKKLLNQINK
jgi:Tfp pilus assembly protein PilF